MNTETMVRQNERSWAIDLISGINTICATADLQIKKAGGETTVSTSGRSRMFPDVILYGNQEQSLILQGWELKMPDVPIEDEDFIQDAQRKAVALHLNSCLIWNFTYAVLYVRGENGLFTKRKQWNDTSHIRTRKDVEIFRKDWEKLLEKVLIEVNGYFVSGEFRDSMFGEIISNASITLLIQRNKDILAENLKNSAFRNATLEAFLDCWWTDIQSEYEQDETDKYKAYAKTVILNWANRLIFAHIIKNRQNSALSVNKITAETSPAQANRIFEEITARCDFYNVFTPVTYNELLPAATWQDLAELSCFLTKNGIECLDQRTLQNILEGTVAAGKRQINGQFTTPSILGRLLVRLTVCDWTDNLLDCCCGTGTIAKAAIRIKKERLSPKEAIETVWACDKYQYPLQIANLSMTESDAVNLANRLFQHNALTLTSGEQVAITNPETGETLKLPLPSFGAVTSNLPFVPFEVIAADDIAEIEKIPLLGQLDRRSDLYCYIAVKISDLLKPGGRLGIITSNSWLGTNAGRKFVRVLKERYHIRQVHISGEGRWFRNANVVTTIMVLEKKCADQSGDTAFWLWKSSLQSFAQNSSVENTLVNSALLEKELDGSVAKLSKYTQNQIDALSTLNVCYNAFFHDINWLLDITEKILPIHKVFHVFRGSRRGWDALFYPAKGEHHIESVYLKKVLLNARKVDTLEASADADAFCCGMSVDALKAHGHTGALAWIEKFSEQKNGVGKPLPVVLKRKGMEWYELQGREIAEIFTMMNPDKRLFFARFDVPSFVNQRLIGLTHRSEYPDVELNHALLNCILTAFYMEASGFGRGLGVLDINKDSIANCYMLNPKMIAPGARERIVAAFKVVKSRKIKNIKDELNDPARLNFEQEVLRSFGLGKYFNKMKDSLLSMQEVRAAVKD